MTRALAFALALLPGVTAAQVVTDCTPWTAQAANIAEPWEANTATFANGEIRVAVLDAIEPGAVPFHLLVLTPPRDELGARICRLVSLTEGGFGFSALSLEDLAAGYDPARGLTLVLAAATWDDNRGGPAPALLEVTVNQARGEVTARLR